MFEETTSPSTLPFRERLGVIAVCFIILLLSLVAYSAHEHSLATRAAMQRDDLTATLKQTQGQIDALNAKMNTMVPAQLPAEARPVISTHGPVAKFSAAHRRASDNHKWKKLEDQLATQGKAIESTRQDLASTRTELEGSIAQTHNEVVLLQKKGERSYYEFDLDKSKQFQHAGPVGISLRKANTKHQYADLELMVEDTQLSKKHVDLYEPVRFYPAEDQQSVELVINSIRKNHIHGYISIPRYTSKDLVAVGAGAPSDTTTGTANSASATNVRRKLELPR